VPYISDVNDPVECRPVFIAGKINLRFMSMFIKGSRARNNPCLIRRELQKKGHTDEIQRRLEDKARERQEDWNGKNCLLSFSGTPRNIVMRAHYADKHKV